MSHRKPVRAVENYTNTCLVMGFVNLLWMLGVIWATLGLPAVLVTGYVLDRLISRIARRRAA